MSPLHRYLGTPERLGDRVTANTDAPDAASFVIVLRQRLREKDAQRERAAAERHHLPWASGPYVPGPQDNRGSAVAWRGIGFATIPLLPQTKIPALPNPHPWGSPERGVCRGECGQLGHGFYDASTDVAWADEYWRMHPDHGIGVRPEPGVIVLDIDPRHDGEVTLAGLEAEYGPLPESLKVISGRGDGGYHLWFCGVQGPLRQQLGPGIDVLCHERSFVVVPPTLHWLTGDPYELEVPESDAIAVGPDWLQDVAAVPHRRPRPAHWNPQPKLPPGMARYRCRGLIRTVAESAEGNRHTVLYWAACRAAADGLLTDDPDSRVWRDFADAADCAGLPTDEAERVIRDAVARSQGVSGCW